MTLFRLLAFPSTCSRCILSEFSRNESAAVRDFYPVAEPVNWSDARGTAGTVKMSVREQQASGGMNERFGPNLRKIWIERHRGRQIYFTTTCA